MGLSIPVLLALILITTAYGVAYAQEYTPEALIVTIFADGRTSVEYRLSVDETLPSVSVPLFGSVYEQLLVVDENNQLIDSRVSGDALIIDTLGASELVISYTTPDLVNKAGQLWTFVLDAPIDASVRLPKDSVVIGMNQIPESMALSESQYVFVMPAGHNEISYVIGALGTREHASLAISDAEKAVNEQKTAGIKVGAAESRLADAKRAFENGKYADAELLANDARTIANNAAHNARLASDALNEAEITITESNGMGHDVSASRQLFDQAGQEYVNGNYDRALSLAQQAEALALEARSTEPEDPSVAFIVATVVGVSAAGAAGVVAYSRSRRKPETEKTGGVIPAEPIVKERRIVDLNKIFSDKPYLRDDDKEAINFIAERGGEAFESEIRDKFELPKTTVWRLVKRLEREEIVEVKKAGGQNLIKIKQEFTKGNQELSR